MIEFQRALLTCNKKMQLGLIHDLTYYHTMETFLLPFDIAGVKSDFNKNPFYTMTVFPLCRLLASVIANQTALKSSWSYATGCKWAFENFEEQKILLISVHSYSHVRCEIIFLRALSITKMETFIKYSRFFFLFIKIPSITGALFSFTFWH